MVWLELIKLPALLAAYPGFIILSLLQQGRGGMGAVCSIAWTPTPVSKSLPPQAPAFPALPAACPAKEEKTLKENALNGSSCQQAGDEMWKKIEYKNYIRTDTRVLLPHSASGAGPPNTGRLSSRLAGVSPGWGEWGISSAQV